LPELPEVEITARRLHRALDGAEVESVSAPGVVPACVASRLLSVRGYDAAHLMIDAGVCEGADVSDEIARQFANPDVAYLHVHNARRGCFASAVVRA